MLSASQSQRTQEFQMRAERRGGSIPVTAFARSKKKPKPPDFSTAWAKKGSASLRAEECPQTALHLLYGLAPKMGVVHRDASMLTPSCPKAQVLCSSALVLELLFLIDLLLYT
ncbi:hypothetical protein NDU88_000844 [Pleurodeles waltl]|uniref:Uncharacterized protein n=1 Tax=Pleurodeles waltl TaxID=8319 RepID=A0AAV7TG60_PLEWA|nr:hypothetical protein NDU88_000844 [Pleurodeles waltl]